MKRSFISLGLIVAVTFALTNCTKDIENPSDKPETAGIPFEIIASTADTKTTNDGVNTNWAAEDAINLFHAEAGATTYGTNDEFTITSENLASNKFTGELTEALAAGETYDWYALYPYNVNVATPGEKEDGYTYIGYSSGLNQTGYDSMASLKGSVCPLYGVAKAVPADETPNLVMEHLSSVVAIKITNANEEPLTVANASFTATEDIVGSYFIDITKTPVAYTAKTAYETATVNVTSGATPLAEGESATLYLAIKPFTAPSGETLTLSVNGYSKTITLLGDVTFSAGKIKTLNFSYDKPADPAAKSVTWDLTKSSYSSATETEVQWVSADIKMTLEKNTSTTVANNYLGGSNSHTRVYKGQILTFTPEDYASINRIEFVSTTKDYADKFVAATWTNAEVESNSNIVVAVPSDASNPVSVKIGDATRFTSITVYYELTAEPPTLVSISISGDYVTEFTESDEFTFGGVVTATYDDTSTKDVTAEATFSGYDMDVTGNQTVTVTYEGKTATYDITVNPVQSGGEDSEGISTYQHIFTAKPATGSIKLSDVTWNLVAVNLNGYNSQNYAGVQFGTGSKIGQITLTSQNPFTYDGKSTVKEIRLWLNNGSGTITPIVTINGVECTMEGTITKNSKAGNDYTKASLVRFTPTQPISGTIVIDLKCNLAGYFCAMEIDVD